MNFSRNQIIFGVIGIALVALLGLAIYVFFGSDNASESSLGGPLVIGADEHTLGSKTAPVQFVEYAAPICPHCARFNAEVFPKLKAAYIDTGKIYYVFRVFPLHPADLAAESMARCLPADNYFEFIDLLFRNQAKWDPEYGIQDVHGALVDMGRIAGLSAQKVDSCIASPKWQKAVTEQGQEATAKFGINGTPSFLIDGLLVRSGEYPWEELRARLDQELAKKKH